MKNILFKGMQRSLAKNPGQWLVGLLMLIAFFFVLFYMVKGIYSILSMVAPVLLLITAIINYRVITGYLGMLWSVFKNNWIVGLLGAILTVVGFPFVSGFLFFKAIVGRKINSIQAELQQKQQGEYVDYEDLTEEPPEQLILKEPEKRADSKYDDVF